MTMQPVRFERVFPVTQADIDDLGHVNNVVYVRWVQDVAAAHWAAATTAAERASVGWVVLRHEIDYKHPARAGDEVVACTWVGPPAAATFGRRIGACSLAPGPCGAPSTRRPAGCNALIRRSTTGSTPRETSPRGCRAGLSRPRGGTRVRAAPGVRPAHGRRPEDVQRPNRAAHGS